VKNGDVGKNNVNRNPKTQGRREGRGFSSFSKRQKRRKRPFSSGETETFRAEWRKGVLGGLHKTRGWGFIGGPRGVEAGH